MKRDLRIPVALGLVWTLASTGSGVAREQPTSPRNANYTIAVELDPSAKSLRGKQTVTWRNIQETPTQELWFHLYWNAWRNDRSTWMLEDRYRQRSDRGDHIGPDDWGWLVVDRIELGGSAEGAAADLSSSRRYASPDDGNPDDRTVMVVDLPAPVAAGETITLQLEWRAKIPRTFARTGFRGDFFFVAHWFPKLGVYQAEGWNCHQFHASTEFFSDYGLYEVDITLPEQFVVGATGRRTALEVHGDGTSTHRYRQADVHSFTWTASPEYIEILDRFESPNLPPVDLRLLIQPEHRRQAARHLYATKAALASYGSWYGPYPYGHLTIVDPAFGAGAGGMEYPTLFTAGTRLFNPFGGGSPEGVTIHEAGHQFWYGLVGNNEFEDAWLDEGLNTFSTNRAMKMTYGHRQAVRRFFVPPGTKKMKGFLPLLLRGFAYTHSEHGNRIAKYREYADIDRQDTPSYRYYPAAGSALSYSKTALWLGTLERWLGWDRLQPALALFFERWQFGHPRPADFFAVLEESTGEDLGWFVDQVFHSSERFDYTVIDANSEEIRVEGLVEGSDGSLRPVAALPQDPVRYRSEVVVRRSGGGIFPVEILLGFEDGTERRFRWRGEERWHRIVEEGPVRLTWAEVDPDGVLLLDLDRTNNSIEIESDASIAAVKWSSRWMVWLEDFFSLMTFFG